MRILIYGAGVLGSQYAAGLHQAGQDVTILARGERYEQIQQNGIVLEELETGEKSVTKVPVVDSLQPRDDYDLVLVMVRANQVPALLPGLAANPIIPNILFWGNNVRGPGLQVEALGKERVLLGFAAATGERNGHIIRHPQTRRGMTYIGELDGSMSLRMAEIKTVFEGTPFPAKIFSNIQGWLKTHVALVIPLAFGIYMAGGDNYRLAQTRDALVLTVRAIREGFNALKALGQPITPLSLERITRLPEPVLVLIFRRLINTRFAEIGLAVHANAARDEMNYLADGLWGLVNASKVPAPSLKKLFMFRDPDQPPVKKGSSQIPINVRELWLSVGALTALAGGLFWFIARQKKERR